MKTRIVKAALLIGTIMLSTVHAGDQPLGRTADADSQLPRPFDVLAVTGPAAGRFHCAVCDYGVRPFVLVFLRTPDENGGAFLKALDGLAAKHADAELGVAAVFLGDGAYRQALLKADDAHGAELAKAIAAEKEAADTVKRLAQSLGLRHAQCGLLGTDPDSLSALKAYGIPSDAAAAVFVFHKLQEVGKPALFKSAPTKVQLDQILAEVGKVVRRAEKANRHDD